MTVDQPTDAWALYLTMAESLRIAVGPFLDQMPTSCCAGRSGPTDHSDWVTPR